MKKYIGFALVALTVFLASAGLIRWYYADVYDSYAFHEIVLRGEKSAVIDGVPIYENDRYVWRGMRKTAAFSLAELECLKSGKEIGTNAEALALANEILEECRKKGGGFVYYGQHRPDQIICLTKENTWIFRYCYVENPDKPYAGSEGGGMTVVIEGKSGKAVHAYIEE